MTLQTLLRDSGAPLLVELGGSEAVREILDVVCETTGMGFAAVAHVSQDRWLACQVRDDIRFGLGAGGELPVKSTLCDTVRGTRNSIVIDEVATDPLYRDHHTPKLYGLQSYIATPIVLADGEVFGTLCAIDPLPHLLNTPTIRRMFSLFAQLIGLRIDRFRTLAQNESLGQRIAEVTAEKKIYSDIVETSTAAVTALGLDGRILAINEANVSAFERAFGKRPVIGDDFLGLFATTPEHLEQQRLIWSRALGGESFMTVQEFGDPQRDRRSFEVRFTPLFDGRGARMGASSTSYDVTDRVAAEAELAAAQEQLRHALKLEAMGQLTGGVAHDFNNLLTPIVGALDVMKTRDAIGPRERRLIAAAAQSAERATVLVQRLLAFARRQPLQPRPVDVAALVSTMSDLVRSTTGPQIRVALEIDDDLPPARADANQLEMALLNLTVNARDAMPEGGELRIAVKREPLHFGPTVGLPSGDYLRLSVADDGAGMDEATRARAVEPFFSTKGVGKGTGLGLSMVDGLARQLSGALALESRPGAGTKISLWLPACEASPPSPDAGVPQAPASAASGLVLLVEDEDLVRMSAAEMLSELGYRVLEAASAEEGLAQIRGGISPDIVVTDHLMPGMSGTELAVLLKTERPEIRVLLVSGYADPEGVAPALARLSKPFAMSDLGASLAGLTARG